MMFFLGILPSLQESSFPVLCTGECLVPLLAGPSLLRTCSLKLKQQRFLLANAQISDILVGGRDCNRNANFC